MFDQLAGREAFRAHLLTLVVATTGSTSLSATSTGYARASGSFADDGFSAGMEVVAAGFPTQNGASIIENVIDDQHITIVGGRTSASAATGRSLTVGVPQKIDWHGTQTPSPVERATRPEFVEQWVPGTPEDNGAIVDTGLYVITSNALANKGLATPLRMVQAIRNHFPPGLTFEVNGDLVRVTGRPAPSFTQPVTTDNGFESSTVRIPWRVMTTNLEAA